MADKEKDPPRTLGINLGNWTGPSGPVESISLDELVRRAGGEDRATGIPLADDKPKSLGELARSLGVPETPTPAPPLNKASTTHSRFSLTELVVFVLGECTGIPLCIAGGDGFAHSDYGPMAVGWGLGLPLAITGATFPFWKDSMKSILRNWASKYGHIAAPVAVLLAFIYVAGPDIYRRATQPIAITGAIGVMPIGTAPISPQQAPTGAPARIIANVTPDYLMELYGNKMSSEGDRLFAPYIAKWIHLTETVADVSGNSVWAYSNQNTRTIVMLFDVDWSDRLSVLTRDQKISALCQVAVAKVNIIYLAHCELESP